VPLGIVAIASLLWAMQERRKRKMTQPGQGWGQSGYPTSPSTFVPQYTGTVTIPTQYTGTSVSAGPYYNYPHLAKEIDNHSRHDDAVELDIRQ
jgi:hypothetical protein